MTLNKSIEAARDGLEWALKPSMGDAGESWRAHKIKAGLSTLPAKPMTEDEIKRMMYGELNICSDHTAHDVENIFVKLRDAGVLYVEEEK